MLTLKLKVLWMKLIGLDFNKFKTQESNDNVTNTDVIIT